MRACGYQKLRQLDRQHLQKKALDPFIGLTSLEFLTSNFSDIICNLHNRLQPKHIKMAEDVEDGHWHSSVHNHDVHSPAHSTQDRTGRTYKRGHVQSIIS
jgi:hypothetical protein